jgi:hypothetical protein
MSKSNKKNETMQELIKQYELAKTQMYDDKDEIRAVENDIAKEERLLQLQWGDAPSQLKKRYDIALEDARNHCMEDLMLSEKNPSSIRIRELKKQYDDLIFRFRFGEMQVQILMWEIEYILKTVESENKKIRVLQIS